jgi:hypothetical protein
VATGSPVAERRDSRLHMSPRPRGGPPERDYDGGPSAVTDAVGPTTFPKLTSLARGCLSRPLGILFS